MLEWVGIDFVVFKGFVVVSDYFSFLLENLDVVFVCLMLDIDFLVFWI